MKVVNNNKFKAFFILFFSFVLIVCVACSFQEQQTIAQINQSNTQNNKKDEFEFLKVVGNPCRFSTDEGGQLPPSKEIYELENAGYPKAVSLDEATAILNRFTECNKTEKNQPPLRSEEIAGAIAYWDCETEVEEFQNKPYDKNTCQEFREILKTEQLPKGAWIDFDGGVCPNCSGYTVKVWRLKLYIKLDKNRRDYKGSPTFSRLLRLSYPSAKRNQ